MPRKTKIHTNLIVAAFLVMTSLPIHAGKNHASALTIFVPDISGHQLDLSTYRGKVVVLNFWVIWCDRCGADILELDEVQRRYLDRVLAVIGIAVEDDLASVEA